MTAAESNIARDITEIGMEVSALRAENKLLREDRDTWKQMAMKLADRDVLGKSEVQK